MQEIFKSYLHVDHQLVIIGFGSIGQAVLPLIFRHMAIRPDQITILTKKAQGAKVASAFGVNIHFEPLTPNNYEALLLKHLKRGDFLLNVSVEVSSLALIEFCQQHGVLYLDTCIEPWPGGYTDKHLSIAARSNYAMREKVLALKKQQSSLAPTAVVTHGANPGLVSHFLKEALLNIAKETGHSCRLPTKAQAWAKLAYDLQVKAIHIAEHDTQVANVGKKRGEFVNTWSVDGFVSEGSQPAELGWGTHEKHWPAGAFQHDFGSQCAIYFKQPGAATRVRTWTPMAGPFHGFLITHGEAISISDYLTLKNETDTVSYRPTVHYAYHPCEDAVLSLHELAGLEWRQQDKQRLLFDEITDGMDELGVLVLGHAKGGYWFGSQLTIHEARQLAPHNNATSLQVAVAVLAGMIWAMKHPQAGIVEPDEMDHRFILDIALPYLGKVAGYYTDWTPLQERERLFTEHLDKTDPWQFLNVLVA